MDKVTAFLEQLLLWAQDPDAWFQFLVVLLSAIGAWLVNRTVARHMLARTQQSGRLHQLTLQTFQRIALPISMLLGVLVGRAIMESLELPVGVLNILIPLSLSLAAIRASVYMMRKAFGPSAALKAWEHLIATSIWILVALHLIGWLDPVLKAMDELAFKLGETRISLLSGIKLVIIVILLITLAFWLGGLLEKQLRRSRHITPSMQVALSKFTKFFLIALSMLVALDAVGIDLTALTVFGGALGVGLGFGLQRIASNFISGFILVLDRSIRPGDVITVGDKFGWVQELRARYIVVRNREGVETLIPNENLITSEVINWSYTDQNVRVRIPVQISYDDDPEQALKIMEECASASPRVLKEPLPAARLMDFADSGIQLELRVWIADPQDGVGTVRSAVNIAIWKAFKEAGITIPYPQRDVHIKSLPEGMALAAADKHS